MGVRLDARLALLGQSGAQLAGAAQARRANPLRLCSPRNVRELHAPVPVLSTAFEVERALPGIYVATAPQELNGERWILRNETFSSSGCCGFGVSASPWLRDATRPAIARAGG